MSPSSTAVNQQTADTVAAVDLGSNSFHMIVVDVSNGDFHVVDRLREMVRLGAGLDPNKGLTQEAEQRALACLERFGQRVRGLPQGKVRAVGTNTLRRVKSPESFLRRAEEALGHPIEIIAGREEARLIYLGVAHELAAGDERRLVIDIGGGSTELIIGDGFAPKTMESMHMGCVSMSQRHFSDGIITEHRMKAAEMEGALEMRPVRNLFLDSGWEQTIGSSGTIRAIHNVVQAAGWIDPREGISCRSLQRLRDALVQAGSIEALGLEGLSTQRRPVFPGGVAVLYSVFNSLKIKHMQVSDKALREGVVYEMLGRINHEDARESTVNALCRRYALDLEHAKRVENTSNRLFDQVAGSWGLVDGDYAEMLGWAARLHEIGLTVSHSQYHKHGAYLVANSDMPGFSKREQQVLSILIRGHRRKIPLAEYKTLPDELKHCVMQLSVLLRLAVLLHRSRSTTMPMDALLSADGDRLQLEFSDCWLNRHPLQTMELEQEAKRLKQIGFVLDFC